MPTVPLRDLARQSKPSVVRIICASKAFRTMTGTGFFIDDHRIVTCAHVLLGTTNLASLIDGPVKETAKHERALRAYSVRKKIAVRVHDASGTSLRIKSVRFDAGMDVGVITVVQSGAPLPIGRGGMDIGDDVMTVGFPYAIQTKDTEFPYAAGKGNVMCRVRVRVGGYRTRGFVQIYCPSMGGASGSPIFSSEGRVVGMLNGQMRWGDDHFAFLEPKDGKETLVRDAFHVPLPYGFATPVREVLKIANALV